MTKFVSSNSDAMASDNSQTRGNRQPEAEHVQNRSKSESESNSQKGALDAQPEAIIAVVPSESSLPTVGQLMRMVSQKLLGLYRSQLNHVPESITCHLFSNKLIVWVDGSVTDVEKRLAEIGSTRLKVVRETFDRLFKPQIVALIEHCLQVDVITLMSDTCYEQGCTSLTVLLSEHPRVRPSRKSAGST
ncbi:MAG: Na-translocating system protein MpsC family protein [Cyanobacteria bacterium J06614_10]